LKDREQHWTTVLHATNLREIALVKLCCSQRRELAVVLQQAADSAAENKV